MLSGCIHRCKAPSRTPRHRGEHIRDNTSLATERVEFLSRNDPGQVGWTGSLSVRQAAPTPRRGARGWGSRGLDHDLASSFTEIPVEQLAVNLREVRRLSRSAFGAVDLAEEVFNIPDSINAVRIGE